jgi:hypothetical protein
MPISSAAVATSSADEGKAGFIKRWALAERWRRTLGQSLVRAVLGGWREARSLEPRR